MSAPVTCGTRRWMHKALVCLVCLVCSSLAASFSAVALGQGRNQFLEEGKRLIHKGRAAKAVTELEQALSFPELPLPQKMKILGYLGAARSLSGDEEGALKAWEALVRLQPDGDLPADLPGDVRSSFVEMRAGVVVLEHLPPPGAFAGRSVDFHAQLRDRYAATHELLLYWRRGAKTPYKKLALSRDDFGWGVTLKLPELGNSAVGYELEYYIAALDEAGVELHSSGSASHPLAVWVVAPGNVRQMAGRKVVLPSRTGRDPPDRALPVITKLPDSSNSGSDSTKVSTSRPPKVVSSGPGTKGPGPGDGLGRLPLEHLTAESPRVVIQDETEHGSTVSTVRSGTGSESSDPGDAKPGGLVLRPAAERPTQLDRPVLAPTRRPRDEVIDAVSIDAVATDDKASRRFGRHRQPKGSVKWVWITLGIIAGVAALTGGIVAANSGDKIPPTSLGILRYPLQSREE